MGLLADAARDALTIDSYLSAEIPEAAVEVVRYLLVQAEHCEMCRYAEMARVVEVAG